MKGKILRMFNLNLIFRHYNDSESLYNINRDSINKEEQKCRK